jgi:hypothetical protein
VDEALRKLERRVAADPADRDARRALFARLVAVGRPSEAARHAATLGLDDDALASEDVARAVAVPAFLATFERPALAIEARLVEADAPKGEPVPPTVTIVLENELRPRLGKGEVAVVRGRGRRRIGVPDELAALLEAADGGTILRPRGELLDEREGLHLYPLATIARGGEIPAFFATGLGDRRTPLGEVRLGTAAAAGICGTALIRTRQSQQLSLDPDGPVLHGGEPVAASLSRFLLELALDPPRVLRRLGVRFIGGARRAAWDRLPYEPARLLDEPPTPREARSDVARRYDPCERFIEGELIAHGRFGEGRVVACRTGEIEVLFFEIDSVRRLAHGRQ